MELVLVGGGASSLGGGGLTFFFAQAAKPAMSRVANTILAIFFMGYPFIYYQQGWNKKRKARMHSAFRSAVISYLD
jgi:preprotein translocase subunit SecG